MKVSFVRAPMDIEISEWVHADGATSSRISLDHLMMNTLKSVARQEMKNAMISRGWYSSKAAALNAHRGGRAPALLDDLM